VKPTVKELLHLPEHIEPFCCIAVGYAKECNKEVPQRYDEPRVHYNTWYIVDIEDFVGVAIPLS
jgi:hypothetical protein